MLRAVLFDSSAPVPTARCSWGDRSPPTWGYLLRHTARIPGLELLAIVAFIEYFDPRTPNSRLWIYVDNNNSIASIVRGGSPAGIVDVMVARI